MLLVPLHTLIRRTSCTCPLCQAVDKSLVTVHRVYVVVVGWVAHGTVCCTASRVCGSGRVGGTGYCVLYCE